MCHYTEVNQDSLAHYNKHLVKHNQDDKIQQNTCSQQVSRSGWVWHFIYKARCKVSLPLTGGGQRSMYDQTTGHQQPQHGRQGRASWVGQRAAGALTESGVCAATSSLFVVLTWSENKCRFCMALFRIRMNTSVRLRVAILGLSKWHLSEIQKALHLPQNAIFYTFLKEMRFWQLSAMMDRWRLDCPAVNTKIFNNTYLWSK